MILNISLLISRITEIIEILMQRAHDDKHEHDYQMVSGRITLEGKKYEVVVRLEQDKTDLESIPAVGYDTLKFNEPNLN